MSFQYLGLKGVLEKATATEAEIDHQMQRLLQSSPRLTPITDRPAALGDEVVLSYAGFLDGEQFPGGTAENQALTLGSGTFIPGFEEQLVGAGADSDVTVSVTFPTDYHAKELAGKEAEFRCHVHEIRQRGVYEMDDTFAREVGKCENLAQMRQQVGKALQAYMDEQAEQELCRNLMQQAAASLDYTPEAAELEDAVTEQLETLSAQLAQKGLTLEDYCQFSNLTLEQLQEQMKPDAAAALRVRKAAAKIADLEGFTISQEELSAACVQVCEDNHMTMQELQPYFDDAFETAITNCILMSKAVSLVRKNAVIEEKAV